MIEVSTEGAERILDMVLYVRRLSGLTPGAMKKALYSAGKAIKTPIRNAITGKYAVKGSVVNKRGEITIPKLTEDEMLIVVKGIPLLLSHDFLWKAKTFSSSGRRHSYGFLAPEGSGLREWVKYAIRLGHWESPKSRIYSRMGMGVERDEDAAKSNVFHKMYGPSVPDMLSTDDVGGPVAEDFLDYLFDRMQKYLDGVIGGK